MKIDSIQNGIVLDHISAGKAMQIYYCSNLADQIHQGMEGIQYLDYKVLAQLLIETEDEKFSM